MSIDFKREKFSEQGPPNIQEGGREGRRGRGEKKGRRRGRVRGCNKKLIKNGHTHYYLSLLSGAHIYFFMGS